MKICIVSRRNSRPKIMARRRCRACPCYNRLFRDHLSDKARIAKDKFSEGVLHLSNTT
jgi:hypothetical protein